MKKPLFIILVSLAFATSICQAQLVYVPVNNEVYDYLQRMSIRSFTNYFDDVKPISRNDAARYLLEIHKNELLLTDTERSEYEYFAREFSSELRSLSGDTRAESRWHLVDYQDSVFRLQLDPIFGYTIGKNYQHRYNGMSMNGSIGDHLGFSFDLKDNLESGTAADRFKRSSPETGINIIASPSATSFEYSEANATIGVEYAWLRASISKDHVEWGNGAYGKLILSEKPPSFPLIRIDINPVKWLRFYYIHAWLQSDVIDSSRSYQTQLPNMPRTIYHEKYLAAHMISLIPTERLNISFGESIVYSDGGPQLMFLNPINFYRAADHYLTRTGIGDGNNSQFFGNITYYALKRASVYGTIFIDEINTDKIFNSEKARNQLGFTVGTRVVNPGIANLSVIVEYTRILPWVYSNFAQTQTYESTSYLLGHYIGMNSDQIYIQSKYSVTGTLSCEVFYNYVRHGGKADISKQYELPSLPFLYGDVSRVTDFGGSIRYNYFNDLYVRLNAQYNSAGLYGGDNYMFRINIGYGI
jgi:hypothetical protein